jgi:hypothetical protein
VRAVPGDVNPQVRLSELFGRSAADGAGKTTPVNAP